MTVRLRVLGTVDLESGSGAEDARDLLAKPKLTALTIYLLLARRGHWHRRDALTALYWPESDQLHARASLSQALYQVRQHLGSAAVETRGAEEVRLAEAAVTCDAAELGAALATGDDRRACALYTGELMPAFHVPDAPEFEHWLDGQRATLRSGVVQAAWRAAEAAEGGGDFPTARTCYRLAGDLSVLDGVAVARAMAGLSRVRERAAALALFERHRHALRADLDQAPDATVTGLAEDIRRRGVSALDGIDAAPRSRPAQSPGEPAPLRRRGRAVLAVLGVAAAAVVLLTQVSSFKPAGPADPSLVAVLPFSYDGADTADRWLARALPVGLTPLLDGTGGLRAVPESRVGVLLAARGLAWDDAISATDARSLARRLGAGTYLTGHVVHDQGSRYVTAALTDLRSGEARQYVRLKLDTLDAVEAIERVADRLLIGLVEQESRARELLSQSPSALRAYVDGWVARRDTRYLDAVRAFHRAMDEDSTFALAALAYREAAMWLPDGTPHRLAIDQADSILERERNHLSPADQAVADAMLATYRLHADGPAVLSTVRQATLRAPDRASAWLLLGDFLLHDGRMLALSDFTTRAAAAFDSARARGTLTPEAERHLVEIRFAQDDTVAARAYLSTHPPDSTVFDHLRWTAAWLAGDSASLATFGEHLDREPPDTWRWMLQWSQRAGVGFAHADRAAALLAATTPLDDVRRAGNGFLLRHYLVNRGRPSAAMGMTYGRFPAPVHRPLLTLEVALGLPDSWIDLDSVARAAERTIGDLPPSDHLWAACHLGTWHAMRGRLRSADSLARVMARWQDDPDVRRRAMARTCPVVIHGLADTSVALDVLRQADSVLLSEPAGMLRTDLTRWNLLAARTYARRGRPDLGLPLTTRLGFIVEGSAYQTSALLLEAKLSLAVGDTARAARAYALAAAFLSDPEPRIAAATPGLADLAHQLAATACGGDCGPYRP